MPRHDLIVLVFVDRYDNAICHKFIYEFGGPNDHRLPKLARQFVERRIARMAIHHMKIRYLKVGKELTPFSIKYDALFRLEKVTSDT